MAARKKIKTKAGNIEIYEKSIVYNGELMFIHQDPLQVPNLVDNLKLMINKAYDDGQYDERQKIIKMKQDFDDYLNPNPNKH